MLKPILTLLTCLSLGCSGPVSPPTPSPDSLAATHDQQSSEALADKDKCAPAVDWLKDTAHHHLWKGHREPILKHFEEQQAAGAKEIVAVDIEETEDNQICASFVLVLPPAPARQSVIARHNSFWKNYLGSGASPEDLQEFTVKDDGQKYLFYNFDL